jgi:hypothetical protein
MLKPDCRRLRDDWVDLAVRDAPAKGRRTVMQLSVPATCPRSNVSVLWIRDHCGVSTDLSAIT